MTEVHDAEIFKYTRQKYLYSIPKLHVICISLKHYLTPFPTSYHDMSGTDGCFRSSSFI